MCRQPIPQTIHVEWTSSFPRWIAYALHPQGKALFFRGFHTHAELETWLDKNRFEYAGPTNSATRALYIR